jgi:hypothetical protein
MQSVSHRSPPAQNRALWWLGLITFAVVCMSIATARATPMTVEHAIEVSSPEFPSGPIVDGRRIQPRAGQFAPPYGRPDVSDQDAREVQELYDSLIGHRHPM